MEQKLLIVDGHNLLFQMFFGMPAPIPDRCGRDIRGVLGFVGALIKIIKMTEPTRLVVLFDGEHENPRAELSPAYKANRPDYSQVPEEENPFSQLPDIYRALDHMGIRHTEVSDGETDDVISAYVHRHTGGGKIVISSFDSDFFQLIGPDVTVLRYRGKNSVLCGPEYVRQRCGVEPERYADFKSLTGDSADNIPGAPRVGPKTAAALIGQFKTLEGVIAGAGEIAKPSVRASVSACGERLRVNYRLIRLDGHAALPFAEEELDFTYPGIGTVEVLRGIGLF